MKMTVSDIAVLVGGALRGEGSVVIENAASLAEAGPNDIAFLANPKYRGQLETTKAGAVLVTAEVPTGDRPAVVIKNPSEGWAKILAVLDRERTRRPAGVHPSAAIAPGAVLGKNVTVGAHAVIEEGAVIGDDTILYAQVYVGFDARIGAGCLLYPHVTVRERVTVGDRCIFQPGVVIGGDGYGFTPVQGRHMKIPQIGTVVIEDDVEIQANTTIDRAAVGVTRIGRGVTLAAQIGVVGHIQIGDNVVAAARSGISHDIKPNQVLWGAPAQPIQDEMKMLAALRRLPKLMEEIKSLKKRFMAP